MIQSVPTSSLPGPAPMSRSRRLGTLALFVIVPELAGALSGLATAIGLREWYPSLVRPSFAPPDWVFGPVWTGLYAMMGIAAWLVWRSGPSKPVRFALGWFVIQLALNVAWSFLFFTARSPGLALLEIAALWAAIAVTFFAFWRVSRPAALLMLPYWAWVTFATALNFGFWRLNG